MNNSFLLLIMMFVLGGSMSVYFGVNNVDADPKDYDSATSRLGEQQRQTLLLDSIDSKLDTLIDLQKQNNCYTVWKSQRSYDEGHIYRVKDLIEKCGYFKDE